MPHGMDWEGPDAIRGGHSRDDVGRECDLRDARFSHVCVVDGGRVQLSYVRDDRQVPAQALQASDGRWVVAGYQAVRDALRSYEAAIPPADPAEAFAEIEDEDAGAFGAS